MMRISFRMVGLALAAVSLTSCSRKQAPEPPVATPAVTLGHDKAPLGSPIAITYRFDVATNAPPFAENYKVFVGVVDADEVLMWTDDHDPPVPTTQWKPGQKIEYTRTVFVPIYPYIGDASVHMGLYSPTTKKRLSLSGTEAGQRAYKVATLQLLPQTENVFTVYKEGWHGPETAQNNPSVEWQWTKKDATLGFRNPRRDSLFYLEVDNPSRTFPEGQHIQVKLNEQVVNEYSVAPEAAPVLTKIPLAAAQLGDGEQVEIHIVVDKTFVPALLPGSTSKDPRELGVRVFHTFIEARK
jgi:hypothetical protein